MACVLIHDVFQLNNISRMELNEIRPFLLPAMDKLAAMRRLKLEERIPTLNSNNNNNAGDTINDNNTYINSSYTATSHHHQ